MPSIYLNHVKVAEESGGVVSLPTTVQFNNLKIGGTEVINSNRQIQNITGIDFGSGSLLTDYEEGTWTPSATYGITIISVVNATYTKVGRQVTLSAWLKVDITTADFVFAGFPFSISGRTCASVTNPSTDESIANQCLNTSCFAYGANTAGTNDDLFFSLTYDT